MIINTDELLKRHTYLSHFGPLGRIAHLVLLLTQLRHAFPYGAFASTCSATPLPLWEVAAPSTDGLFGSIDCRILYLHPNGVEKIDIDPTTSQLAGQLMARLVLHSRKSVSQRTKLRNYITKSAVKREPSVFKRISQLRRSWWRVGVCTDNDRSEHGAATNSGSCDSSLAT